MFKKIYQGLVAIRKELQAVRSSVEFRDKAIQSPLKTYKAIRGISPDNKEFEHHKDE